MEKAAIPGDQLVTNNYKQLSHKVAEHRKKVGYKVAVHRKIIKKTLLF